MLLLLTGWKYLKCQLWSCVIPAFIFIWRLTLMEDWLLVAICGPA